MDLLFSGVGIKSVLICQWRCYAYLYSVAVQCGKTAAMRTRSMLAGSALTIWTGEEYSSEKVDMSVILVPVKHRCIGK